MPNTDSRGIFDDITGVRSDPEPGHTASEHVEGPVPVEHVDAGATDPAPNDDVSSASLGIGLDDTTVSPHFDTVDPTVGDPTLIDHSVQPADDDTFFSDASGAVDDVLDDIADAFDDLV